MENCYETLVTMNFFFPDGREGIRTTHARSSVSISISSSSGGVTTNRLLKISDAISYRLIVTA